MIREEIKALLAAGVPAIWGEDSFASWAFFFEIEVYLKKCYQVQCRILSFPVAII